MHLPHELTELFTAFANAGVEYLLVGGHAVAAHGRPRATKDVDLWLRPEPENVQRACRALELFGLPTALVDNLRRANTDDIVWFGRAPTRIDILQKLPGVDFAQAWPRRVIVDVGGVQIGVISKDDLVTNKRTVGRAQDLRDVRALTREPKHGNAKKKSH